MKDVPLGPIKLDLSLSFCMFWRLHMYASCCIPFSSILLMSSLISDRLGKLLDCTRYLKPSFPILLILKSSTCK